MSVSKNADYTVMQKALHWLIGVAIMADLFIAQKFGGPMEEWDRFESRSDHASIGTVVAVLFVARMYLRLKHGAPPLPDDMTPWQRLLAHLAHWALYAAIAVLILTGMLSAVFANSSVEAFGVFAYGDGVGNIDVYSVTRLVHELTTKTIIALIVLHILAALYHLIIVRDGVTERMLRFWKSGKSGA
ncbi:MAG: cytochrome b [Pseudomonadota bacterium]